ncbi:serine/threonine-protein phosphatase 7 long form homolog [Arachis stenosperma]|uniref:serine/threonine-protein phosphatase 7 long form homolog n=1 Tax=Arachis stenosperma TaxID=217475 RepID=UPI0025ABAC0B|nr:serine/threonine-protein phosphatase 7 long form homolog [Arachis stenosperma]
MQETRASIKNLEVLVGQLSKQILERSASTFQGDTVVNPGEDCKAIQLRSGKVAGSETKGSRMLICDHYLPSDPYNPIVEGNLRETGFYHVSHIGVVQCQSALVNALIEILRPETHTFHFPIGECVVTLEDMAVIYGLPTNGIPVTGPTLSSYEALGVEYLQHFGVAPRKTDRESFVKFTWFRRLKAYI